MNFIDYLKEHYHYTESTLRIKQRHIKLWKKLCLKNQKLEKLTTKEILNLLAIQKNHYTHSTLNNHIRTLEQYYHYQIHTNKRKDHPLQHFRILTDKKATLNKLLNEKELTELYENYPTVSKFGGRFAHYQQRNKVLLGLMVYQALTSGTLQQLQITDIDLDKGTISIPKTTNYKLNPRILKLESNQILELHHYIHQTRNHILRLTQSEPTTNKLFPTSINTGFSSITHNIRKKLQIENLQQLRYSRITIWKKHYNLREVQYKAGYKSLLSLEKFDKEELEELKQAIEKYHPMS